MLVRATDGLRLCREGGHERLPRHLALGYVPGLSRIDIWRLRGFLSDVRLTGFPLSSFDRQGILALLGKAIATEDLVVLRARAAAKRGASDSATSELRRLVKAIDANTRGRLSYAGRQYKLVADVDLERVPGRDYYEIVPHDTAVATLRGLAGQGVAPDLAELLGKASARLTQDWRPPLSPDGLILLRRLPTVAAVAAPEPALTPSQIKKLLHKTDWIEIEVVDDEGLPYTGPYRLELSSGSSREGRFDETGCYGNYDLDPGNCTLKLPEVKVVAGAGEAAPPEPTPEPVVPDEEPTPEPTPEPEPEPEPVEYEFSVRVVDETGAGVGDVPMIFDLNGTPEDATTDADGVASVKASCEQYRVSFAGAQELWDAMAPSWQSRAVAALADYVQPDALGKVVTARPAAIEDETGEALQPITLAPALPQVICVRQARRRAVLVEWHDTLFRTDSAVVMPEGEAPAQKVGEHESLTSVGLFATLLRYNEEHEGKKLFIAGHADRSNTVAYNQPLSEERAQSVLALLTGDRDSFVAVCSARNSEVDVTQVMDWSRRQYGFACKPTTLLAPPSSDNYVLFRRSFNAWVDDGADVGEDRGTKIGPTGRLLPDIWSATFDLYEYALGEELGEDGVGLAALRAKLQWVDDSRKLLGFSKLHPVDENRPDGMRSQEDRRVEVMMFDAGDEPDLAEAEADPEGAVLYDSETYERTTIPPMLSAKPWLAYWDDDSTVKLGDVRGMLLDAPGLPAGESVKLVVLQDSERGVERTADAELPYVEGSALGEFETWFNPDLVNAKGVLTTWPKVSFQFSIEAGGRVKQSSLLDYSDSLDVKVTMDDAGPQPASKRKYWILNSWGRQEAELGDDGKIVQDGLPPGGTMVMVEAGRLDEGSA